MTNMEEKTTTKIRMRLESLLPNSLVHMIMIRENGNIIDGDENHDGALGSLDSRLISPLNLTYRYIIEREMYKKNISKIEDDNKVKYMFILTTSKFDIDTFLILFDEIFDRLDESSIRNEELYQLKLTEIMGKIDIIECSNLETIDAKLDEVNNDYEIQGDSFVIVEDLCEMFNIEFFINYTHANNLISKILVKLRRFARSSKNTYKSGVILYERELNSKKFNSIKIEKFISNLYDYELRLIEFDGNNVIKTQIINKNMISCMEIDKSIVLTNEEYLEISLHVDQTNADRP